MRAVVGDKRIKDCTKKDGRAVVAQLIKEAGSDKIKRATLRRRMVPLIAAVNWAIEEGESGLTLNPFEAVIGENDGEESDTRKRFDDDDMKLIRENLHKLSANDQLLVRLLATTGVSRSEAFQIASEKVEDGIRFCVVGTKTDARLRRVPFPADLLPYLPPKITGKLIHGRMDTAGKRLKKWLHEVCKITDDDKAPMHSFRHRAAKRMRAAGIPEDVREAIGGWANGKKKTSRKYGNKHGKGYPIKMLKEAIDTIGF